jgi:hypothetical protein
VQIYIREKSSKRPRQGGNHKEVAGFWPNERKGGEKKINGRVRTLFELL